jgi:hypothetical protein
MTSDFFKQVWDLFYTWLKSMIVVSRKLIIHKFAIYFDFVIDRDQERVNFY